MSPFSLGGRLSPLSALANLRRALPLEKQARIHGGWWPSGRNGYDQVDQENARVINYHLLLIQTHGLQDVADFEAMRDLIHARYPDIRTYVLSISLSPQHLLMVENHADGVIPVAVNIDAGNPFWKDVASKPTLMFAPIPIDLKSDLRGFRLFGEHVSKPVEMRLLASRGFSVPRSLKLDHAAHLDESEWGPLVIVKPQTGRGSNNVRVMRTREAARIRMNTNSPHSPGPEMLVQQWIDTGPFLTSYRVMTVLDKVIYIMKSSAMQAWEISEDTVGTEGLSLSQMREPYSQQLVAEQDVHQLASVLCRAFSYTTSLGLDILRDSASGKLYVIEMNSGYPTWHLSSRYIKWLDQQYTSYRHMDRYTQFNAIEEISHSLAQAVYRLAR